MKFDKKLIIFAIALLACFQATQLFSMNDDNNNNKRDRDLYGIDEDENERDKKERKFEIPNDSEIEVTLDPEQLEQGDVETLFTVNKCFMNAIRNGEATIEQLKKVLLLDEKYIKDLEYPLLSTNTIEYTFGALWAITTLLFEEKIVAKTVAHDLFTLFVKHIISRFEKSALVFTGMIFRVLQLCTICEDRHTIKDFESLLECQDIEEHLKNKDSAKILLALVIDSNNKVLLEQLLAVEKLHKFYSIDVINDIVRSSIIFKKFAAVKILFNHAYIKKFIYASRIETPEMNLETLVEILKDY